MEWMLLIVTTLGAGAVGSIITTYGTQARARVDARSELREAVSATQALSPRASQMGNEGHGELKARLEVVERTAQIAGVRPALVELYRDTVMIGWVHASQHTRETRPEPLSEDELHVVYGRVASHAARLLLLHAWHPWQARLRSWHRVRHLRMVVLGAQPTKAEFERDNKRRVREQERRLAKAGRAAVKAARKD